MKQLVYRLTAIVSCVALLVSNLPTDAIALLRQGYGGQALRPTASKISSTDEQIVVDIQAGRDNDWLALKSGKEESRYYLSKPVLVEGINGKWKKRYLGSRAKAELHEVLGRLRVTGVEELRLRTDDKHVQYALLTPEIESGEREHPYVTAIIEEHPDGERLLWTKPTPGLTEKERYGQLLEFLVPLNAKPRTKELPSWREEEFTTTKTTEDYPKGVWGETKAQIHFGACDGCLQCAVNCPDGALMVDQDGDLMPVDKEHCTGCKYCAEVCPIHQITLAERKSLVGTAVSKVEADKGERTELAGGLVKELTDILIQEGLLIGKEVSLGDFKAKKAYLGDEVLQVELLHKDAVAESRPLVITFIKQDGEWHRAWIRQKKAVLSYGMGELELRMVKELQREGYSIIGAVNRERFRELSGVPNSEWERANNRKDEFTKMGFYLDKSLMEVLDSGLIDVVVTGESSWLRGTDKRAIMEKTGYGLWVISPHNILETKDRVLDGVMERIYEDIQANSPEAWYKWVGRAGYATSLFARLMLGLRGISKKVYHALVPGHRLCPACPQPKIVEEVCQMAAHVAGREGKTVKRLIIANTGCLTASGMSNIYGTTFKDPAGRILFGNAVAVASGIEVGLKYLRRMEKLHPDEKFEVIVFTGDGGDADIGLQQLLGAVERGHKIRYFVFNNEMYSNTGGQRSGATPMGARTKSTVPGLVAPGKMVSRKVVADYVAQHHEVLVIESNPDEETHFQAVLERAFKYDGFVYCNLSSTCHTGQGYLGEQARSVSRTRIHTGMSPLVIRTGSKGGIGRRTNLEIPPELKRQELESSLLNWLSTLQFFRDFTDSEGERLFVGEGASLEDKKLSINSKYKALEILRFFQPVTESMILEGRFSHLVDQKGEIKQGTEPIVFINQLDIIIRLLALFKDSEEFGDDYTRKEYQELINVIIELRSRQQKAWALKEAQLRAELDAKGRKIAEKKVIVMNGDKRQRNAARLGEDILNIEWFGFAGWGVQSAGHLTSDMLHLIGVYPIDWPSFGPERAGAPVESYNKAGGRPTSDRSAIKSSQIAMVLDETHLEESYHKERIFKTLSEDGILFVNTTVSPEEIRQRFGIKAQHIITADLSGVVREKLGDHRRVSVAALGALARALELKGLEVDVDRIRESIASGMKKMVEANLSAFDAIYANSRIEASPPKGGVAKKYELPRGAGRYSASPISWRVATGNETVAKAVLQGRYGVYAGYPITPSTTVGEYLSELQAQGLIDTEVLLTESEYAAMSALVGSAAAGTLSFTATDAQGLLLMHEVLPVAAGLGLPIIMYVANRAITRTNLSIFNDHSDSMAQLTTGWAQLYAKNNQELYDLMIIAPLLWKYLRTPIMVNGDGFNLSHTRELVDYLTDEEVEAFQKEVDEILGKVWKGTMAPGTSPASYMEAAVAQDRRLSLDIAYPKIMKVLEKYKRLSKREYSPVMEYGDKDAKITIVAQGSAVATAEKAIEMAGDLGINLKVLDIKSMVPFPYPDIAERISSSDTVIVMDRSTAPGLYPPLLKEVRSAADGYTRVYGEIYGLGGRNPQPEDILEIIKKAVLVSGASDRTGEAYQKVQELLVVTELKAAELAGENNAAAIERYRETYLDAKGEVKKDKKDQLELAQDISDLLLELAYLHIADMRLDEDPFSSPEEQREELVRYLNRDLIKPLLNADYIQFSRVVGHAGVREGVEDERNKRIRVVELLEIERAIDTIRAFKQRGGVNLTALHAAALILNFSDNIIYRDETLGVVRSLMDATSEDVDPGSHKLASKLLKAAQIATKASPAGGVTNIHPTQPLETSPILDAVPAIRRSRFVKGYYEVVKEYLVKKEQIYIPRLLGVSPGTSEYEELKGQSGLPSEEFDQLFIRQSALFLDEDHFNLNHLLAGRETKAPRTEGWVATAMVTEEKVRTEGPEGEEIIGTRPRIQSIIELGLAEEAAAKEDYETIVTTVYHELIETHLLLFIRRLGLEKVYTKDQIHNLTRRLEIKNFGASRVSPDVSKAQIAALEIEVKRYGLPKDALLRKYHIQSQLLKRLETEKDPKFNAEEARLLDELVRNGYSGVGGLKDKYRLAGLRKITGEQFDSVLIESRREGYTLTGEVRLDPVTGLKKVYLGDEVIPTLIEILESLGDKDAVAKVKAGGRAALLEMEGYPLYLGIVWEGITGDTILWSKEPPAESGLVDAFYTNYIALLSASAVRNPEKRFTERGYEGYEPATMLDLEGISSLHRRTSDWAEQMPVINWARCVNCLHCAFKCPDAAMMVQDGTLIGVDPEHCKGCAICQGECMKQGHNAIMMINKDELEGLHRGAWLDKRSAWQTRIQGGLANHLYEFLTKRLEDKRQILLGDYVVTSVYKGRLPEIEYESEDVQVKIGGEQILQLQLLPKAASESTKPLVYTFVKVTGSDDWQLIIRPQKNILVLGTGETEARMAIEAIKQGFEVRVVRRFSPDNQPVYYDVAELEKYTEAFNNAGLWADKDVIELANAYGILGQAGIDVSLISKKITLYRERLGRGVPDYLVTGELDLISEKLLRASIPLTGQPVIAPGEAYISRDSDLDEIMDTIFQTIPYATAEEYAKHADVKIPKGHLDRVANYLLHFAGGHSLCTGCDAGIIAGNIISAAVAAGEKLGKKMRVVFVGSTGCLEVSTTIDMISYGPKTGPKYRLQISYLHSAFDNLGASISGVIRAWEARKAFGEIPEDEELIVVGVGGDGGTHDIGIQALSGAWERGEHVFYVEYNNGAYMNTGIQGSSATPEGAVTTTTPHGKVEEEKDMPEILAAHQRDSEHLIMTSSTHDLADFMTKLEEGILHAVNIGPAYLGICATCVPGHRLATPAMANKTNQIAVETAAFISYTIKDGLLELAPYTPEAPEWDPDKKDYIFRYRYKDKSYKVYGDDYIRRRVEFARMHREDGGRNMQWITLRPIVDRLWAEGRFRHQRNNLEFINRLQQKIIARLQGYLQRGRITKKIDRLILAILDQWKQHPEYKNIFRTVADALELERDIYVDIKPEHRALVGRMRRLLASSPSLEGITDETIRTLSPAGRGEGEGAFPKALQPIIDTVESVLIGEAKLKEIRRAAEEKVGVRFIEPKKPTEKEPELVTQEQKQHNQRVLANELVTVAWKSRGGKGAVMANKLFAKLLLYLGGFESDFPFFGPERQGAPIEAFLIAGGGEIMELGVPLSKDFTIVLDEAAWEDVQPDPTSEGEPLPRFLHGQAEDGVLLVNTDLTPEQLRDKYGLFGRWNSLKIYTIDANAITEKHGGDPTKPNMALLGAALRAFQYFGIEYNKDALFKIVAENLNETFGPAAGRGLGAAFIETHENIVEEKGSPKRHKDRIALMVERIVEATAERYPEGVRMDGNEAVAKYWEQIAHFLPVVFATYPITPTTQVGEIVSGVAVYNRKLGRKLLEYLRAESEHSALSACVAAALSGCVAGFATGSQGLAYAWEIIALADDLRTGGLQLFNGNREENAPLNILYGRADSDTLRRGWLKFIAATQQEVYDFGFISLLASYLARRPAQIDYAGFFITHTGSDIKLLPMEQVKKIAEKVEPLRKRYENMIDSRKAWGYVAGEPTFEERNYQEAEAVEIASQRAILDAFRIFGEITGRKYEYFRTYKLEDAEQIVAIVGAHGKAVQKAIDELRDEGINVGMFSPRVNGPFVGDTRGPDYIAERLKDKRLLQVVEHFNDAGEVYSPLGSQIATALFSQGRTVPLMNWIMSLGGRTPDVNKIKELIKLGIILGHNSQAISSEQMRPILDLPEAQMAINRLVAIHRDKLLRNYPHYSDEEMERELSAYREKITGHLALRDYINFLGHKEYADVRRESNELDVKTKLIKLLEVNLARAVIKTPQDADNKLYSANVLYYLSGNFADRERAIELYPGKFGTQPKPAALSIVETGPVAHPNGSAVKAISSSA